NHRNRSLGQVVFLLELDQLLLPSLGKHPLVLGGTLLDSLRSHSLDRVDFLQLSLRNLLDPVFNLHLFLVKPHLDILQGSLQNHSLDQLVSLVLAPLLVLSQDKLLLDILLGNHRNHSLDLRELARPLPSLDKHHLEVFLLDLKLDIPKKDHRYLSQHPPPPPDILVLVKYQAHVHSLGKHLLDQLDFLELGKDLLDRAHSLNKSLLHPVAILALLDPVLSQELDKNHLDRVAILALPDPVLSQELDKNHLDQVVSPGLPDPELSLELAKNPEHSQVKDQLHLSLDKDLHKHHQSRQYEEGAFEEGDYSAIPGEPGQDYPILSEIPETSFACEQQQWPGYYADVETRCQVFHICANNKTYDFLCPNGTIFHQEYLVCVWWNQFDCNTAPSLFGINANIYDYSIMGAQGPTYPGQPSTGLQGPSFPGGPGPQDSLVDLKDQQQLVASLLDLKGLVQDHQHRAVIPLDLKYLEAFLLDPKGLV
ncbi:CBM 14 domain containing protein, partial [Asbolus verrucosus]